MASSLFQKQVANSLSPQQAEKIKSLAGMLKGGGNPMSMLSGMLGNGNVNNVLKMLGNGNPKDMFYQKCQEMNIDPNEILNLLK